MSKEPSLRAKRGNPELFFAQRKHNSGLLRRDAPRNDEYGDAPRNDECGILAREGATKTHGDNAVPISYMVVKNVSHNWVRKFW